MRIKLSQLRRIIREQLEEEQERSELDKIKDVFAASGKQAVELADMVGLGSDPVVKAMKDVLEVAVDMLDTVTTPDFKPIQKGDPDMWSDVWGPMVRQSLAKVWPVSPPASRSRIKQANGVFMLFDGVNQFYGGWRAFGAPDPKLSVGELSDWASHPVEMPK
jgi:hypothetical protein